MNVKYIFFGLTFYFLSCFCNSQTRQVDSLKVILKTAKEDTNKVNTLNRLSWLHYNEADYSNALKFANQAKELAQKISYYKGKGKAHLMIGWAYFQSSLSNADKILENFLAALKSYEQIGNKYGIAESYLGVGSIYLELANAEKAIENIEAARKIYMELNEKGKVIDCFDQLGSAWLQDKKYNKSIENYMQALEIVTQDKDKQGITTFYERIGDVYMQQKNYDKAMEYHKASLEISKDLNDLKGTGDSYSHIGDIYHELGKFALELENYLAALKCYKESSYTEGVTWVYSSIGRIYYDLGNYEESLIYYQKSLQMLKELGGDYYQIYDGLSATYAKLNDFKNAYHYKEAYSHINDSIIADFLKMKNQFQNNQSNYEIEKREVERQLKDSQLEKKEAQLKKESTQRYALYFGLTLVVVFSVFIFNRFQISKKQNVIIKEQKHLVEKKHKEITDSINYAERIQRSFLAAKELLDDNLKEYFVFFKPKDVVSGDFYWASKLSNNSFALVTADSTGHGVPGAIMSLLNVTSLEKAIEHSSNPSDILNQTRNIITERLKKDGSSHGGKDGMDCSLICFDFTKNQLQIALANNPVWIIRNNELIEIKPDKMPVGKSDRQNELFTLHTIDVKPGDTIYTLTDGYPDQFGGPNGKKFMSKKLKELLLSNVNLSLQQQKEILETSFNNWVGELEQVDDVCVIGIKI